MLRAHPALSLERLVILLLHLWAGPALDTKELEREHQTTRHPARVTIGEVGGYVNFPFVTLDHSLHGLGPAADDLIRGERCGTAAVIRGVECLSRWPVLSASPLVMAFAG